MTWLADHWRAVVTGVLVVAALWVWAGLRLGAQADERAGWTEDR